MEKLVLIINDWDPIGFFPMAPKDEYSNEINKIYEYLYNNRNIEVENLAREINTIFKRAFGTDVYVEDMEKCKNVASEILDIRQVLI